MSSFIPLFGQLNFMPFEEKTIFYNKKNLLYIYYILCKKNLTLLDLEIRGILI